MKKLLLLLILFSNEVLAQVGNNDKPVKGLSVSNKPQHDPPEVVNEYTAALAFDACKNEITVADATAYKVGDTVLLIQMKGAVIDTSNTATFGTIIDYKNAGNYEFNYISQKTGNKLTFKNRLTKAYDIPNGVVQLIRVPYFKAPIFTGGLTCLQWDGTKGGVLAVISRNGFDSFEDIDLSGMGFRGGEAYNAVLPSSNCSANEWNYPAASQLAAFKGESIASLSQTTIKGKGSPAGGGGGGLSHNSGGGGGGNAGAGGFGGYQSDTCNGAPFDNRGVGGKNLMYSTAADKIFMGSGGGAGHIDNADFIYPNGGNGGGIIIIITDNLTMAGHKIISNGRDADACGNTNCSDGMSGGGAGGTILVSCNNLVDPTVFELNGGNGANMTAPILPGGKVGAGGGGGGGAFFINNNALPGNATVISNGGLNGVLTTNGGNAWGATSGTNGLNFFNLVLPVDATLFTPNIDSVRIMDSVIYCNKLDFKGRAFTNTNPIASWHWDFGDGATANTQNSGHNYAAAGTYTVKLIATDINGCKDSITKSVVTTGPMLAEAGADTSLCSGGKVSIQLNGNGPGTYSWSPAVYLNNSTAQNPLATITVTTKFYLTVTNGTGCSDIDSVTITLKPDPVVQTLPDTSICKNAILVLTTNGALTYTWSPAIYVSNPNIASPQFTDSVSRTLIVTGTIANGCSANDTIAVNVKTPKVFLAPADKSFCYNQSVQLDGANGNAVQYSWSPATYLNNTTIINPVANPPFSTVYRVTVTDKTCNYDSSFVVSVTVLPLPILNASKTNDINCKLPFTHLNASGALEYSWSPAVFLNNSLIASPVANPTITTTFVVSGTAKNGCTSKDSVKLNVNFGNEGFELPNSFTPNGDGVNDCFGIRYYREVQNLTFLIYNRYGEKVFETKNAAECWDGYYRGKHAEQGSYIYYLSAKTLCGDLMKKGSILLIR
ncbi:T9SS type B sorting domain-containing protein [Ferruginibacter profundus]